MQTLPMYHSERGSGDYLRLAASMHLPVTSQGQPILVTSSSAAEDPEVGHRPMTPPFDVWLVTSLWVWVPR